MKSFKKQARLVLWVIAIAFACFFASASAQVTVDPNGSPRYTYSIPVPPGIAGLVPSVSLRYVGPGVNGQVGYGWQLQAHSVITRCSATLPIDGGVAPPAYFEYDKICLDGERLIPTNSSYGSAYRGLPNAPTDTPVDAAAKAAGTYTEYRTEKDSDYVLVRSYGAISSAATSLRKSAPAYFKVFTKDGRTLEYGENPAAPGSNANLRNESSVDWYSTNWRSTINSTYPVIAQWALSRVIDAHGNSINYRYSQLTSKAGTQLQVSFSDTKYEWFIDQIRYGNNAVRFTYEARPTTTPADVTESHYMGGRAINSRRLASVSTYINVTDANLFATPGASAVPVQTTRLNYDNGPVTKRSRLTQIQQCAGVAIISCLPAQRFEYSPGGGAAYVSGFISGLSSMRGTPNLGESIDKYGVIPIDLNRDGRTDILRYSLDGDNQVYLSQSDASFLPAGSAFNGEVLHTTNGCRRAIVRDFNGDGYPDLMRYAPASGLSFYSYSCTGIAGTSNTVIYFSSGGGYGPAVPVTGITLDAYDAILLDEVSNLAGRNFYVLDVNGDGKADIVVSKFYASVGYSHYGNGGCKPGGVVKPDCVSVYIGDGAGNFTLSASSGFDPNWAAFAQPSLIPPGGPFIDVTGDGRQDIDLGKTLGAFDQSPQNIGGYYQYGSKWLPVPSICPVNSFSIDFIGDKHRHCLTTRGSGLNKLQVVTEGDSRANPNVGDFSPEARTVVTNFPSAWASNYDEFVKDDGTRNSFVIDANGDGREDIVRWDTNPANNTLYLSNGDGTFVKTPFLTDKILGSTYGSVQTIRGDFTGYGRDELLVLRSNGAPLAANEFLYPAERSAPDLLTKVISGLGAVATLQYASLAAATLPSDSLSPRYRPEYDVSTSKVPVLPPSPVVVKMTTDTGVGTATSAQDYVYYGLKAGRDGRGLLGFREVRSFGTAADGSALTTTTTFSLDYPYIGRVLKKEVYAGTYTGALPTTPLSSTINTYCHVLATAAEVTAAMVNKTTCDVTATRTAAGGRDPLFTRPYLLYSETKNYDTSANLIGTTSQQTQLNASGYVAKSTVVQTLTGDPADTFTTETTTDYFADATNCSAIDSCLRLLAAPKKVVERRISPDFFRGTSAGTAPNAAVTSGAGIGGSVNFSKNPVAFGSQYLGYTPATQSVIVTNLGASTLTITGASITAGSSDYVLTSNSCTSPLAPNGSCALNVQFTPSAAGVRSGTMSVTNNGTVSNATVTLSGTGTPLPTTFPAVAFGNVVVGANASAIATLTNNGTVPLGYTIPSAASVTGTDFSFVSTTCSTGTLAPGASCTVSVKLAPTVNAPRSGSLAISSWAGTQTTSLTGTGVNQVLLNSATLPSGRVNVAYSPFSFFSLLSVSDEPSPDPAQVLWSSTGALPTGMSFSTTNGTLSGTPTVPSSGNNFTVVATYKSKTGQQVYTIQVARTYLDVTSISMGSNHACAITSTGGAKCWGDNTYGQLGDGTNTSNPVPTPVSGLSSGVTVISAGRYFTCAVVSGGAAKCWGYNSPGVIGDGTLTYRNVPTQVSGLTSGVSSIAAGTYHACMLSTGGAVKCWGNNTEGQLGNNDPTLYDKWVPTQVSGLTSGVAKLAIGGNNSCVVTTSGAAKCWGQNSNGKVGDNTTLRRLVPTAVSGLTVGVSNVAVGFSQVCALTTAGAVKCWGSNSNGSVGDGTTTGRLVPTQVSGLTSGVTLLAAARAGGHTCALVSGVMKCWGRNNVGQIGNGTAVNALTPVPVTGMGGGVVGMSLGDGATCAWLSTGLGKCWGENTYSQLGDTTTSGAYVPVDVLK